MSQLPLDSQKVDPYIVTDGRTEGLTVTKSYPEKSWVVH